MSSLNRWQTMQSRYTALSFSITFFLLSISSLPAFSQASSRPNVLLILTDQQTADALSAAGNNDLKTPAMDRLAANGVRFTRAYCAQPLRTPSRTAIFSGKMPLETGFVGNAPEKDGLWPDSLLLMARFSGRGATKRAMWANGTCRCRPRR